MEAASSSMSSTSASIRCPHCQKRYKSGQGLRYHMSSAHRTVESSPLWSCPLPLCRKSFTRKSFLVHHVIAHTKQRPFACLLCEISVSAFSSLQNLAQHAFHFHLARRPEGNLVCRGCGVRFDGCTTFAVHFRQKHLAVDPIRCPLCDLFFLGNAAFSNHVEFHTKCPGLSRELCEREDFPLYACDVCPDGKFDNNFNLYTHLKREHQTVGEIRMCLKCGMSFGRVSNFIYHTSFCAPETLQRNSIAVERTKAPTDSCTNARQGGCYQCEPCGLNFFSAKVLVAHYDKMHPLVSSGQPPAEQQQQAPKFACCDCGRAFDHIHKLEAHVNLHKITVGVQCCGHCEETFSKRNHLLEHVRLAHADKLPLSCCQCQKRFANADQLRVHLKVHNKQHVCPTCDKRFAQKCELKRHMICHSNEASFACAYCNKKFKYVAGMKQHVKNTHVIPSLKQQAQMDTVAADIVKETLGTTQDEI